MLDNKTSVGRSAVEQRPAWMPLRSAPLGTARTGSSRGSHQMADLIPVLQTAIGPVILISGIGLLLLTMTNRLGRAIDRARLISSELSRVDTATRAPIEAQLHILWRRACLIRMAITLAAASALAAALLVILIFFTAVLGVPTAWLIASLFTVCMLSLIASLVLFIHDINQSLAALRLELHTHGLAVSNRYEIR